MLRLTKKQFQAFSHAMEASFVRHTKRHLLVRFLNELAAHGLREHDLEALIQRGISEAEAFGVVRENDVRLYVECMVVLHPHFARDPRLPWAAEILQRTDLTGTSKIDLLHDHVVFGVPRDRPS